MSKLDISASRQRVTSTYDITWHDHSSLWPREVHVALNQEGNVVALMGVACSKKIGVSAIPATLLPFLFLLRSISTAAAAINDSLNGVISLSLSPFFLVNMLSRFIELDLNFLVLFVCDATMNLLHTEPVLIIIYYE